MSIRPYVRMYSADDVRETADRLGSSFFDPANMRFFDSRLLSRYFPATPIVRGDYGHVVMSPVEAGYFVTSERYGDDPRHYKVRRIEIVRDENGQDRVDIVTAVDCLYLTAGAAFLVAEEMAAGEMAG